ncbi:A24 family peptidase [soil metagenome]
MVRQGSGHQVSKQMQVLQASVRPTPRELVFTTLAALTAGFSGGALGLTGKQALISTAIAGVMMLIALVDYRCFTIPDWLSLPGIPVALIIGADVPAEPQTLILLDHLAAALASGVAFYLLRGAYRRLRGREGLGLGDVKLMMLGGALVGTEFAPYIVVAACAGAFVYLAARLLAGSAERIRLDTAIPFGTFLAPSIWAVWLASSLIE